MDYKKDIKNLFLNDTLLLNYRYNSSRDIFIFMSFLFFLNYFLVWANFYDILLIKTLPLTYVWFVFSLLSFLYFFILNIFPKNKLIKLVAFIVNLLLFIVFLLPLI